MKPVSVPMFVFGVILCIFIPYFLHVQLDKPVERVASVQEKVEATPYKSFWQRHNHPENFFELDQNKITQYQNRVMGLLSAYESVTPRTCQIWQQVNTRLGFAQYVPSETVGRLRQRAGNTELLVGLFSSDLYQKVMINENKVIFAYQQGSGLVLVPAMDCPDTILAASFYHELGHLLYDLEGLSGVRPPRQPVGSQEYFEEEVEMTELTGKIMDKAVNGQFIQLIDQIIDRSGANTANPKYTLLHQSVTDADLKKYEDLFAAAGVGEIIANSLLSQFQLTLDFRFIDRFYRGQAGPMVQKVERYRRLIQR